MLRKLRASRGFMSKILESDDFLHCGDEKSYNLTMLTYLFLVDSIELLIYAAISRGGSSSAIIFLEATHKL